MSSASPAFVMGLDEVDRSQPAVVGGKGANLGELSGIDGVRVPTGFCVTTDAFTRIVSNNPVIGELLDQLSRVAPGDQEDTRTISAEIRRTIEATVLPEDVASEISDALTRLGGRVACAVRSSATAEDLPTASFAGQHDSYLNVVGRSAILDHVRRCWASTFTERAVIYRQRNHIDHRGVRMAVVVQQMVEADVSGVMFTADPVNFDRTVVVVEALEGLGEALVSGLITPAVFKVRDGAVVETTRVCNGEPPLTNAQVTRLAVLGRRIEAHFGCPQDIEWCLLDGVFRVVQSRPITTLFPVPPAADDTNHVYVSVGHQQMMTDAMKPLGLSLWQMTTPAPMSEAGGRLFVDVTARLAAPSSRDHLLDLFGASDPLLRDALQTVLDRGDFVPSLPDDAPAPPAAVGATDLLDADPAIVDGLIEQSEASIAACRRDIRTKSGAELFDFIRSDMEELRRVLFDPRSRSVYMTAMEATQWLNEHLLDWLGEKNVTDILTQSVPHNITSEMGLALLDVADVIRPHPEVVAFLHDVGDDDGFLGGLDELAGGPAVRSAFETFLDRYGMRCVGEIDITRPRWNEHPSALLPVMLAHVAHMEPGEAKRRFEVGRQGALTEKEALRGRLLALPDGDEKAAETAPMIDRVRTFIGFREYPKYAMVCRYAIYRHALLAEAERLAEAGVLAERDDIYFLRFDELHDVVRTGRVADEQLIARRKDAFGSYERLMPPRVLTSDGEAIAGTFRRDDLPSGALAGLVVSGGTIEGRARVVCDIADADLEPGDILVTTYTDPSWTPQFVSIAGLVTEVGGMMTHGAVIAREYGLPAIVGVERATERIRDGQRIRLDGTEGYVLVIPSEVS